MVIAFTTSRSLRAAGAALSCLVIAAVVAGPAALSGQQPAAPAAAARSAVALADLWERERVMLPPAPLFTHDQMERRLREVHADSPDLFSLEQIGVSVEGRGIHHLWFGRGPMKVLMWSQMHGDEPTATSALFDLFEHVRRHRADPHVAAWLDRLTVHVVPMLNPDGAERFARRNAQAIDINRDALLLQTPEGRVLKALRDRLEPQVGFNLHNQNWRTSVGRPPKPASMSLLAVAYDEERSVNEGRLLTKKLSAVIRDAVEALEPGQVGRYDDEFEVRAFGDNITRWGTNVVLIETGPHAAADPDPPLVRMNFVALVTALDALASGRVHEADPARYDALPLNESRLLHTAIRHATIQPGTGVAPFLGDVGIVATRVVRQKGEERTLGLIGRIEDLGDLRVLGAMHEIDGTGLTLAPLFQEDVQAGATVTLPDWSSRPQGATIAPGQPARLVLLRPIDGGRYIVERVIVFDER
jgi:hypothetical protein